MEKFHELSKALIKEEIPIKIRVGNELLSRSRRTRGSGRWSGEIPWERVIISWWRLSME